MKSNRKHEGNGESGAAEPDNDDVCCSEECKATFDELTKAGRYFSALAVVLAEGDWSKMERDLLSVALRGVMSDIADCASALGDEDVLQRLALLMGMAARDDKQEAKNVLTKTVAAARTVLEWGEVQEIVTTSKLKGNGVKVKLV
jgi:hypothetical protein